MEIFIILTNKFFNKIPLHFLIPHCKLVSVNTVTLLSLGFHTALFS